MAKNRIPLYVVAYLLFVLAVWGAFTLLPHPKAVTLEEQSGVVDLTAADFDGVIYHYLDNVWEHYPEALLTPQDFDTATPLQPSVMDVQDYRVLQYATHRVQFRLPPGKTYALSMRSSDYSMRLFVDDEELIAVGSPGATAESNVPGVAQVTCSFRPTGQVTTILVQSSNWVHREGAFTPNFYLGTARDIGAHERYHLLVTLLLTGSLLTGFLHYLGMFVLNPRYVVSLLFSVCCLFMAAMASNFYALFLPGLSWYTAFRAEYIIHFCTFAALACFLDKLFPRLLHRAVTRGYYVIAGLYVLTTFMFPPRIYSALLPGFEIISVGMIVYVVVRLAMQLRERRAQNVLAFAGMLLVCVLGLNDILYTNNIAVIAPLAGQPFSTPIGMVFFMFCYSLGISIDHAEAVATMEKAQQQVAEAEARVLELLMKSELPAHALPGDFGLSQRETDVLWLMLDGATRNGIADTIGISRGTVNTYCSRIYNKTNTNSLTELYKLFGVAPAEAENFPE